MTHCLHLPLNLIFRMQTQRAEQFSKQHLRFVSSATTTMTFFGGLPLPPLTVYSAPATAANVRLCEADGRSPLTASAWLPSVAGSAAGLTGRSHSGVATAPFSLPAPFVPSAVEWSATQYADRLLSCSAERRPISVPAAVELAAGGGLANLLIGPVLQCLEAATLGQPFEVGLEPHCPPNASRSRQKHPRA